MGAQSEVNGPEVLLPGSQQLAPVLWLLLGVLAAAVTVTALLIRYVRSRRARSGAAGHARSGTAKRSPPGGAAGHSLSGGAAGHALSGKAEHSPPEVARRRPPMLASIAAVVTVVALVGAWLTRPPPFFTPEFPPIGRLMPDDSFFHRTVTDLPVHERSQEWIRWLEGAPLRASFGGEPHNGVVFGMPFNLVDDDTPRTDVRFRWPGEHRYTGPYPVASPAYIESLPGYGVDNHYIALDRESDRMWELIGTVVWFGQWEADSGALWDLTSNDYADRGTTASWLPLLPGVVGVDEALEGRIDHVLLGTTLPSYISSGSIWPGKGSDGRAVANEAIPMGAWLRLRSDTDLSGLGPQATAIAEALQRYGIVLADSGGTHSLAIRGTADGRWNREDLQTLSSLNIDDFEVVDASSIMVDPDSMAAEPPPAG